MQSCKSGQIREDAAIEATSSTCGFCPVGCGLKLHLSDGQAVKVTPASEHPVNLGMACPKGWEALGPLGAPDRATSPWVRNASGELEPTDWDTAMRVFTARFKAIQQEFGPGAVAWLAPASPHGLRAGPRERASAPQVRPRQSS